MDIDSILKIAGAFASVYDFVNGVAPFFSISRNHKSVLTKLEELRGKESDMELEVRSAELVPRRKRKREVEIWFSEASETISDAERALHMRGFKRLLQGNHFDHLKRRMTELQEKGNLLQGNGLVVESVPRGGEPLPTARLIGNMHRRVVETFLEALGNSQVGKLGLYEMSGSGKSVIMKNIHNQLVDNHMFDILIWVGISTDSSIKRIQDDIALAIDVDFLRDEDETRRASKLLRRLSQLGKFALFLDDVRKEFSLEDVGVPEPDEMNGCKLILAARCREACQRMNCVNITKLGLLPEDEAFNLFKSRAIGSMALEPEVEEIANLVATNCTRLPLVIVTIAASLKGVDNRHEWRNALNELIGSLEGVNDDKVKIIKELRFSFVCLRDQTTKCCFLHCATATFVGHHEVLRENLIDNWINEGLIGQTNNRDAVLAKGHTILKKLGNSCLLESTTDSQHRTFIKMPDLLREMACEIAENDSRERNEQSFS